MQATFNAASAAHGDGTRELIRRANDALPADVLRRLGIAVGKGGVFVCPSCQGHKPTATFRGETGDYVRRWRCTADGCEADGSIVGLVELVRGVNADDAARIILSMPTAPRDNFYTSTKQANALEKELPAFVGRETRAEIAVMNHGSTCAADRPRGSDDRQTVRIMSDQTTLDASSLIAAETTLDAAKAAMEAGLRPIPIYAIGETIKTKGGQKASDGKAPIGSRWGKAVWSESDLEKNYGQNPDRNVGLLMGPQGGIIDIEMDRPADMDAETFDRLADEELAELCGGEIPETVGWRSGRGVHRIFRWDDRLAVCDKNAFHHGRLEIRLGVNGQTQSVIPPSRHAAGERAWLDGSKTITNLPDVAIERIIEAAKPKPKPVKPPASEPVRNGTHGNESKRLDDEAKRLLGMARSLAQNILSANKGDANTGRHPTALASARTMAGFVAGHRRDDLAAECRSILIEAYRGSKPELSRDDPEFEQCIGDGWDDGTANPITLDKRGTTKPGHGAKTAATTAAAGVSSGEAKSYYDDRVYHDPHIIAKHLLKEARSPVVVVKGVPYRYDDGIYLPMAESDMRAAITRFTANFFEKHHEAEKELYGTPDNPYRPIRQVSGNVVANVRLAVDGICTDMRVSTFPAWQNRQPDDWPEWQVVTCANGLLNAVTGEFQIHTPRWLSVCKSEARWEGPDAQCPRWLKWLNEVMPGDDEEAKNSRETLQMWFGYLLVTDRSHHKMLNLVGERRTGKGTTLRFIKRLVGAGNIVNTSLTEISGRFGLEPLVNKTVAMIGDSRPGKANADLSTGAERLLGLTGGDSLSIDRKNKEILPAVELPVRVVIASNGHFNMPDPNGVLPTRLVTLRFDQSFAGRENPEIENELAKELPGILAWAVRGYRRLVEMGGFHELESTRESCEISQEIAQPLLAFLNEAFTDEHSEDTEICDAFAAYVGWLARHKPQAKPMSMTQFRSEIGACRTGVKVSRRGPRGTARPRCLVGVTPNESFDRFKADGESIIEKQLGERERLYPSHPF